MSCGARRPCLRRAWKTPKASKSLPARTAVTLFGFASRNLFIAISPAETERAVALIIFVLIPKCFAVFVKALLRTLAVERMVGPARWRTFLWPSLAKCSKAAVIPAASSPMTEGYGTPEASRFTSTALTPWLCYLVIMLRSVWPVAMIRPSTCRSIRESKRAFSISALLSVLTTKAE